MTNEKGEQGKETTVVYSVEGGGVTVDRSDEGQASQDAAPAAVPGTTAASVAADERVLSAADGTDVEYEPVVYSDPGQVTEQFDHLATRDPEEMTARMGSGDAGDDSTLQEPTTFSPEAAALAGGNEVTLGAERGAVTRVHSNDYDLADPETDSRS